MTGKPVALLLEDELLIAMDAEMALSQAGFFRRHLLIMLECCRVAAAKFSAHCSHRRLAIGRILQDGDIHVDRASNSVPGSYCPSPARRGY